MGSPNRFLDLLKMLICLIIVHVTFTELQEEPPTNFEWPENPRMPMVDFHLRIKDIEQ